jgi:hypothetical protein
MPLKERLKTPDLVARALLPPSCICAAVHPRKDASLHRKLACRCPAAEVSFLVLDSLIGNGALRPGSYLHLERGSTVRLIALENTNSDASLPEAPRDADGSPTPWHRWPAAPFKQPSMIMVGGSNLSTLTAAHDRSILGLETKTENMGGQMMSCLVTRTREIYATRNRRPIPLTGPAWAVP